MQKNKKIKQLALILASTSLLLTGCGSRQVFSETTDTLGINGNGGYYTTDSMESCDISELPIEFNTEEYNTIKENSFVKVSTNPLSTFAMDVDTGSYTNFRRMVNDEYELEEIPSGAIRTEEMVNYFTYDFANKINQRDSKFKVSYELQDCPWNENNKVLAMTIQA
jgi:hypothetical protein